MMIHLVDQDTKETFQCYGDNEVKAAIAAARASGKIVNMELDDNRRDCLIYIVRDKYSGTAELPVALTTEAWHSITEIGDLITETVEKMTTILKPFDIAVIETIEQYGIGRAPSEIKKEIKHTKNPMRLSQLYRELDEAYKRNGRKKK